MNIRSLISFSRLQDSITTLESVLDAFQVVRGDERYDLSDSAYYDFLKDAADKHNLSQFIFDVSVLNAQSAEWRRVLEEMDTKWVSFYGAHKVGPNHYERDRNRLYVGTRNLDFVPLGKHPKGVMESGTTWNMQGNEKKQDYVRFFDRVRGDWRSTVKTFIVGKGKVPDEEQIPYEDYIAKYGVPTQPPPSN